jgi:hypothetical protein
VFDMGRQIEVGDLTAGNRHRGRVSEFVNDDPELAKRLYQRSAVRDIVGAKEGNGELWL